MIVGTVGFMGSGKGTVGDILALQHGFKPMSFAGSLKDAASNIFGWERKLLEGDTDESRKFREQEDAWWTEKLGFKMSPRIALQKMGTEGIRNVFHPDIWILSLQQKLKSGVDYVITDVRFPNELDFITSLGGKNILIRRDAMPEWYEAAYEDNQFAKKHSGIPLGRMQSEYPDVHYSEWAWIGHQEFDWTIRNDSSLDVLKERVLDMVGFLKKSRKKY